MQQIEKIIDHIISAEGGYINHPNDKGGPTNYGITIKTLSDFMGKAASITDIKNLDVSLAKEIYISWYYYTPRINTLPERLQHIVTDMAVNHGPKNAVKMVQRVLNQAGFGRTSVDGVIGPDTRKRVEKALSLMDNYLINAIVDERNNFYKAIVARNASQEVFLDGWLSRSESFRVEV